MQINEIDLKTNNRMNSEVDIVKISIFSNLHRLLPLKMRLSKGNSLDSKIAANRCQSTMTDISILVDKSSHDKRVANM